MGEQASDRLSAPRVGVVVTGTWGTGKTSLLEAVADEFPVVSEPGRRALAADPTLAGDWERFTHALLRLSLEDLSGTGPGMTLFDRGLVDCLAYARWFGLDETSFARFARGHRYAAEVLVCPPRDDIYTTDDLRKADFEMACDFHRVLLRAYEDLGYRLVEVSGGSIDERVSFLRDFVDGLP